MPDTPKSSDESRGLIKLSGHQPALAGTTYFLGIGIDEYQHWDNLRNAVRDMKAVADNLKSQYAVKEWKLLCNEEATRTNIVETISKAVKSIEAPDSLIIYYAGHGHIDTDAKRPNGFLVPTDAPLTGEAILIRNATIRDFFGNAKAQHLFLISDACFSGSLLRERGKNSPDQLLTKLAARPSRLVLCSGRHDEKVSDGPLNGHSPFAEALLAELRYNSDSGLSVGDLARAVLRNCMDNYEEQLTDFGFMPGVGDQRGELVLWRDGKVPEKEVASETPASPNTRNSPKKEAMMSIEALTALAAKVYGFIKPVIMSEVGQKISDDFKNATKGTMREMWQKIKPLFIKEDEEDEKLDRLKKDQNNKLLEEAFVGELKYKLSNHPELCEELQTLLAKLESSDDQKAQTIINDSKNVVIGSTFTGIKGNIHIGDNTNSKSEA